MDFEVKYTPDKEKARLAYQISGGKASDIAGIVRACAAALLTVIFAVAFVKKKEILDLLLAALAAGFGIAELKVADKFKSERINGCCEGGEITVKANEDGFKFIYEAGEEIRGFKKIKKIVKKDGLYAFRFKDETDFRYIPEDALDEENKARLEELLKGVSCYKEY